MVNSWTNYVLNEMKLENPFNCLRENARFYSHVLRLRLRGPYLVEEYNSRQLK